MGPILVVILRLFVPLTILRWPFWGALVAILLDTHDQNMVRWFGSGWIPWLDTAFGQHYQLTDKLLDMYYLTLELIVVWRWQNGMIRKTAQYLYFWRLLGFITLEITRWAPVLILGPNVFENFFIFCLVVERYFPQFEINRKNLPIILIAITIPKIAQEYMIHVLDSRPYVQFKQYLFGLFR